MARTRFSPRSHFNVGSVQIPAGKLNIAGTDVLASAAELNIAADNVTGYPVQCAEVTFTETTGAGTYTGSVAIPAGATILDVIVHATALWNTTTSATLKVGDATDDDGIYTGVDLKATDLLAGESLSFSHSGGKGGAYLVGTATHWTTRYLATARVISGIITSVGAAGTLGRTRMIVVFTLPVAVAATKV